MPRIENRECSLDGTKEEKKDRFVHQFKVANRSFSVAESSPARAGTKWSEREKGSNYAPGDSKGRSPWRAFGDFPRVGKVTRGGGAERPPHREERRGGAAPLVHPSSHRQAGNRCRSPSKKLSKQLGPDLRHQRVLGQDDLLAEVLRCLAVPQAARHHHQPCVGKLVATGRKG